MATPAQLTCQRELFGSPSSDANNDTQKLIRAVSVYVCAHADVHLCMHPHSRGCMCAYMRELVCTCCVAVWHLLLSFVWVLLWELAFIWIFRLYEWNYSAENWAVYDSPDVVLHFLQNSVTCDLFEVKLNIRCLHTLSRSTSGACRGPGVLKCHERGHG